MRFVRATIVVMKIRMATVDAAAVANFQGIIFCDFFFIFSFSS